MPKQLPLPSGLSEEGWKVKIRDVEGLEPPHATVIRGTKYWRWNLRERTFMDRTPDPRDVQDGLVQLLQVSHDELVRWWDAMFPWNPVAGREDER